MNTQRVFTGKRLTAFNRWYRNSRKIESLGLILQKNEKQKILKFAGVVENIEKMLTILKGFDIVITDELPETVGAAKRKDKTPTEERIVVN